MTGRTRSSRSLSERFEVGRELGRGGMASVYVGHDRDLDRAVALKVLAQPYDDDPAFTERFRREARLAARLVHPNIVQVYDVGEGKLGLTIVMEFVEGENLAQRRVRLGRLPAEEVSDIGRQLCSALAAAHAQQLVHRDVKPQNVIRRPDGQVKLADFGIARSLTATSHTAHGTVLGTLAYLAPEQARGEQVTAAADFYSLGVLLYELLTGQTPFPGESLSELFRQRENGAVIPPGELVAGVPPTLESAILRCLAPDPDARPASAAALGRELGARHDEPATLVLPARAAPPTSRDPADAKRWLLPVLVAAIVFAVGVGIVSLATGTGGTRHTAATTPPTAKKSTKRANTPTTRTATTRRVAVRHALAATPVQALQGARAALAHSVTAGQIDPGAANDLENRLSDISRTLGTGNTTDASHEAADLLRHLGDLARSGQVSTAALSAITPAIDRLIALLPDATPAPAAKPVKHGHGHGHGHGPGHKAPHPPKRHK